jgi:hypothetical protein
MPMIAVRPMTPGGCETRESGEQESKSAIQQKYELAEMIAETEIFEGNAERSAHSRSGIGFNLCGRYAGYHQRNRKEESSQSTWHSVHLHSWLD